MKDYARTLSDSLRRRNGRFTGFPVLGVKWQRMESAGLRASYQLTPPLKGVLVRSIWATSPLAAVAGPDDIIMRFDGIQVACDGTVPFRFVFHSCIWHSTFCISTLNAIYWFSPKIWLVAYLWR